MANKQYLDADGVTRLKEYIDDQIKSLQEAINLLNGNSQTPGSIEQKIDEAINNLNIYGGSAPEGDDQ